MDLELKDKVVLVTGGAKGIGEAISRALCSEGALPVILDRDADAAHELHLQLSPSGVVVTELSSAENCRNAVAGVIAQFGRLDALVKFAECVRASGLPDFPDPTPQGTFAIGRTLDMRTPQAQKALETCRESNPIGGLMLRVGG